MQQLIDAKELASKLGVPVSWVYDRTRRTGPARLPFHKIGKYVRFSEHEVMAFLESERAKRIRQAI